jgi:cell division protein FtsI/penicillin-binding protein 2
VAAQLIGYTDIDNRGSEGLEMAMEGTLGGTKGSLVSYVDARGRLVPGHQQEQQQPQDGNGLVLTIDALYQDILEEELEKGLSDSGAETALGVITDPRTGEILAMANAPLYDPNAPGETAAQTRRNRTVTDPFEPGSTFKVITGSAALEDQVVRPEEIIFCENGRMVMRNGSVIRDHDPYGSLTFREVIEKSSNIGTLKVARRLQRGQFYEHLRSFGVGLRTGIELPSESAGLLHPVNRWSDRSLETIAIGQEVSLTALQLAQAVGAIANGGTLMAPQLCREVLGADGKAARRVEPQAIRRVVSEGTSALMRDILAGAVERGTGKKARIQGVAVAGKTGTAQRAAPDGRGYIPGEIVASFVGFLPADQPELLCLIVLDNPQRDKWGGALAAPIFKRVVERILYLSGNLAAQPASGQQEQQDSLQVLVPELRGMTGQVARFQADLRGLAVRFDGRGDVVVSQDPLPGSAAQDTTRIVCTLGEPESWSEAELAGTPLRQSLLLKNLSRIRMASLE